MKISVTVSWCAFLLLCWVSVMGAQQQAPPATPPTDSTAQDPPQGPQDPQTPPPAPPQNPPQNPPDQTPISQPRTGIRQPPPPLPKVPDIRMPGETGYWVGISGWLPTQTPTIYKGKAANFTPEAQTKLQGKPKITEGAEVGLAVGLHNALRFTYFTSRAAGDLVNPYDTQLFNQSYPKGEIVSTNYKLQNFKVTFDYLTYPYPVESRRFRLKTLWGLQFTNIHSVFDLPTRSLLDPATGLPIVDTNGNPITFAADGSRSLLLPTFGLGVAEYFTRNFRIEANGSGFGFPHHYSTWDADASLNFRFGHFELKVGAKAFHFKTSVQSDYYFRQTMGSAQVGLRWYSD